MKEKRFGNIYSYASYKANKVKWRQSLFVSFIGIFIITITIVTGRFQKDLSTFIVANDILLFLQPKDRTMDDVYFKQDQICYGLYTVPRNVKGIYIPGSKIGQYEKYIQLAKDTGINSFVIDVKDDTGQLTFATEDKELIESGAVSSNPTIKDVDRLMMRLREADIYPIARIVAFKDNVATKKYPERAVKTLDGRTYMTSGGDRWLDPYNKENWKYLLQISRLAHKQGFKEIQFDYVRFHESMNERRVVLDENQSKTQVITEFTKYICENLEKEGVKVSADVFGAVVLSDIDANIVGQNFKEMSKYLDYISPMIYPSHYAEGTFGIAYPHLDPYHIIFKTMNLGQKKISLEDKACETTHKAEIRPWLQDFTLKKLKPYLEYGPDEIRQQIEGARDAGVDEWLFWNAGGNYTAEGLIDE